MRIIKNVALLVLSVFMLPSCQDNQEYYSQTPLQEDLENQIITLFGSTDVLLLPQSDDFNNIPSDENNPLTAAKVKLGKFLFHETSIAKSPMKEEGMSTYSCASCHHAAAGFQSGLLQGIGEGGIGFGIHGEGRVKSPNYDESDIDVQPIRSPSVLNSAYQKVMLWNGQFGAKGLNVGTEAQWTPDTPKAANLQGFEGVETQAIAGLSVHRLMLDKDIIANSNYKALFDEGFPNVIESERYTLLNGALAIAAFERTVLPNDSPFQHWLNGDTQAMSEDEIKGGILFFDKAKCYTCHSGPGLNGMSFHALGMHDLTGENVLTVVDDATKKGRGGFTGKAEDDYKFKTPQLYNLLDVSFYGHGGSFESVRDVISYKNNAVAENKLVPSGQISSSFEPLGLTETEIDLLTLFVERSLYDSNLKRYQPEALPSGNCVINADSQSSQDMGCD